jgi:Ca2+-binding EF-hand superfamily protein
MHINSEGILEIMAKHDIRKDGHINYEEFRQIFFAIN